MMIPLHERYRPTTLPEFIGQHQLVAEIQALVKTETIGPAVLLYGPTGAGKTTLARIISKAIGADPFWDWCEIDAGECNIGTVRQLRHDMRICGKGGGWRVWIVDECHTMSKAAREAFLSLIEKMPDRRVVIFCTTDPKPFQDALPLWHRVHRFRLEAPQTDAIRLRLTFVGAMEGYDGEIDYAGLARRADDSFREGLALLQRQIALLSAT